MVDFELRVSDSINYNININFINEYELLVADRWGQTYRHADRHTDTSIP